MRVLETCERCHRAFGGIQAFRRGHPRGRCRSVPELRRIGLRQGADGVWHRPASTDVGQLRLRLFGRGRPRKSLPIYSVGTRGGRTALVRRVGRRRHEVIGWVAESEVAA